MSNSALVWFRRDLRDFDHAALHHALAACPRVFCGFVFDREILDELPSRADRRVAFIHASLIELDQRLRAAGGGLIVRHGRASEEIPQLAAELGVSQVLTNRDYEPAAIARDALVAHALAAQGIEFAEFKDQVIFECDEILTQTGKPYAVFTPFRTAWLKRVSHSALASLSCAAQPGQLCPPPSAQPLPSLADLGFEPSDLANIRLPTGMQGGAALWEDFQERLDHYKATRDFPAVKGVSYLSTHLRFGTVSIRQLARHAWERSGAMGNEGAATWLSELIWREFYQQILWHRPDVVSHAFRAEYDTLDWATGAQADADFAAWCAGRTGYPIVDAAMHQLSASGYMHNRLRMIVASFLTKDLGIHWLRGERFFAQWLCDYDLAANNGGWQWAASTGCDAQPYFRIFNPVSQGSRFDPDGRFVRRYLPALARVPDRYLHAPWTMPGDVQRAAGCIIGQDYPAPIVDHAQARTLCLARFSRSKTP